MSRRSLLGRGLVTLAIFGALVPPAAAQEETPPTAELSGGEIEIIDFPTLEMVVSLPSSAAADVTADSFAIVEPDQTITPTLTSLSSSALDVVLAIDTSGSMSGAAIDSARTAAASFVLQLPDAARIAVVGFGPTAVVASPLTSDRPDIASALFALVAGGETALHDAIIASANQIDPASTTRTALVILSDGGDTVSTATLADAAGAAADRFDVVHAVSLTTSEQDAVALESLVSGGGAVVQAEDPVALAGVYNDVGDRIINQYALRWDSSIMDDASIEVRFTSAAVASSTTRLVDLDDALVAALSEQPTVAETVPTTPSVAPTPAPTVVAGPAPLVVVPESVPSWMLWVGLVFVATALFLAGAVALTPPEKRRSLTADFRDRLPRGRELSGAGRLASWARWKDSSAAILTAGSDWPDASKKPGWRSTRQSSSQC